jgi:uncharacterized protein YbaP (TraB family)
MTRLRLLFVALPALLAATPSHAEPALWAASSPTATIYLFGTVHLLTDRVAWRSPRIDQALADSSELWLELANASDTAATTPYILQYATDPVHPLSTKLNDTERARLKIIVDRSSLPGIDRLEPYRPWMVALMISLNRFSSAGYSLKTGVEAVLSAEMTGSGRPVRGLETIEDEFRYFNHLSPSADVQMLDEAMDDIDSGTNKLNAIVAAWQEGDVETIGKLIDAEIAAKQPDAYQALIVNRNIAWARSLRDRLRRKGTFFVAVGAGHLAGPDSVQAQLAQFGIATRRE